MKTLSQQELLQIEGGGSKWAIGTIIAAGVTFIIGVVDGILRPLRCN